VGNVSEAPFKIELDLRADRAVVRMIGELDVASAPQLRETVLHLLEPTGNVGTVVFDLSAVTFVDSTGLGVIAASRQRVEREGGELVLRGPRPNTVKVLEITGLDRVFTIER
jgi:anti-sigma B factor antagonist